jgi:uncharacterized protein (TIGR02466 family)
MDRNDLEISPAFATPIMARKIPELEALNPRLKEIVLARETRRPRPVGSNIGGWQSDHDLMDWHEPEMDVFRRYLGMAVQEMTSATVRDFPPEMDVIITGWANIARDGAYTRAHSHDGSIWSIIYYVCTDPPKPDRPQNGMLGFIDPRSGARTAPRMVEPFSYFLDVQPEPGTMIVFPGWLLHEVHPYYGDDVRISLSANAVLVPDFGDD